MKEQLLSAHIDADGEVIAMTRRAAYQFNTKLKDPQKLIGRLAKAQELDLQYWTELWAYSAMGSDSLS